ncbi:MAG: ATP-dependent sacrificial sulfur transferase LarE [Deltaproteobacteria bacterium]
MSETDRLKEPLESGVASRLGALRRLLQELPSAIVAYSGGVDSSFVLAVACETIGAGVVALTTNSAAVPERELAEARVLADRLGAEHLVHRTDEVAIDAYAANPTNRCYFCKDNLYRICHAEAERRGIATILDGVNCDDLGDFRPGLDAAREQKVRHPLVEVGMTKDDVRQASAAIGLATWDKPAQPCLASRFPYGTSITHARLNRIELAEEAVHALGFREFRVRFVGEEKARLEIAGKELSRATEDTMHKTLVEAVRAAGFAEVVLDLRAFRSGRLNEETPAAGPSGAS